MPKPPEQREAGPAKGSSGYARRHRGSRNRNRTGPPRSMRSAACTCSVRARRKPAGEFPGRNPLSGFSARPAGAWPGEKIRLSGSSSKFQSRASGSPAEQPGAPRLVALCVSLKHLEMSSPRCPQQPSPYYRVGASENTNSRKREEGRRNTWLGAR